MAAITATIFTPQALRDRSFTTEGFREPGATWEYEQYDNGAPINRRRNHTSVGALDAGSIIDFGRIDNMRVEAIYVTCSAFGASRVIDVGVGYLNSGVASAFEGVADCLIDGLSVASALPGTARTAPADGLVGAGFEYDINYRTDAHLLVTVAGGTWPAGGSLSILVVGRQLQFGNAR